MSGIFFVRHPKEDTQKSPLKARMTILDYGCNPAHYNIPLVEVVGPAGRVYAIDIQPLVIEVLKKQAA
jgi:23S rRNA U2552 (ribose-2'-O)-methylase RlmE/FtsJ